jgi:HEPN domain-containing protein
MPRRLEPTDPREWINRAKSSLFHAESRVDGVYLEDLCFDAQQAAEKAIKAVLLFRKIRFPYVHDIQVLLSTLLSEGHDVPKEVWEAMTLTPFAVEARYPSIASDVTEEQYIAALQVADAVVAWASALVNSDAAG